MRNELINYRIQNNTSSILPVELWGVDNITTTSLNATTRYTWNVTFGDLSCGYGSIVVNGTTYPLTIDGTLQGLVNQLNSLNFGTFGGYTSGASSYIFTADDINSYTNLILCDFPLIITMVDGYSFNVSGDPTDVANWNARFNLPTDGTPFTSVSIVGYTAYLYGGQNINLNYDPFGDVDHILYVIDNAGCIVSTQANAFEYLYDNQVITLPNCTYIAPETFLDGTSFDYQITLDRVLTIDDRAFSGCTVMTQFNYPTATTIGANCFDGCVSARYFNLGSCTNLGGSVGDNGVFNGISGNSIRLVIPSALMTCNGGNPDGDIQYLVNGSYVSITFSDAPSNALILQFEAVGDADTLVGDASNVSDWNTFFDLPTYGNPFTSVQVFSNSVYLRGGSNITIKPSLFYANYSLRAIDDQVGSIVAVSLESFLETYIVTINMPSLTSVLGDSAFQDANYLLYANLPNLTNFGTSNYTFNNCYALYDLVLPYSYYTSLNNYTFSGTAIQQFNFPNVTTIGEGCFNACIYATSISIPNLTYISDYGFSNCNIITSFDFPLATGIGNTAFGGCDSLQSVNSPLATSVGGSAFGNCNSIVNINFPLCTTIGNDAFSQTYATQFDSFYLPSCTQLGDTVGNDGVFNNIAGRTITLTIPSSLMTCNSGNPDGDIQYLQANNTVTIVQV